MEKYGEIPKRFTKAWWGYFWYYYKLHTMGVLFVVIAIAVTLVQCATRVRYDLQTAYVGDVVYNDRGSEAISSALADSIEDITGNGKKDVLFQQITIAKEGTDNSATDYNSAMITKLDLDFQSAETYLYFLSGEQVNRVLNRHASEGLFDTVDEWAKGAVDAAQTSKKGGAAYAVSLRGNEYFAALDFNTDDLYMLVRKIPKSDEDKEKSVLRHSNAVRAANKIMGFGE